MQVAADLGHLDELGRLGRAGLAQLGRDERQAERGEDALLVGRVGQRLVRGDPLGRAGRADELGAQARRLGDDQLDRHALDRHAERAPVAALDDRHDLRQGLEPLQHRPVARDDDGEPLRRVAPAARVARRDPAERLGDRLDERPAAVQQQRSRCCGLWLSRQRRAQLALGLGPDPRHLLQPSGLGRLAQLRERADAEHAADLEHALDRDAEEAPEPGELRRDLALELLQLGDLAGLDQLDAAAARSPARSRAARGRGPGARARRPAPGSSGSGRPRGGRPAMCTARRPPARAARRTGRAASSDLGVVRR